MIFLNAGSKVIYLLKFLPSHLRVVVSVSVSLLHSANLLGALNTRVLYCKEREQKQKSCMHTHPDCRTNPPWQRHLHWHRNDTGCQAAIESTNEWERFTVRVDQSNLPHYTRSPLQPNSSFIRCLLATHTNSTAWKRTLKIYFKKTDSPTGWP